MKIRNQQSIGCRAGTFPSARKSLLFERVPVNVKSVEFPQARRFAIQKLYPAHPFHAFITIEVWHDDPERVTVFGSQRFAVMTQGEKRRWVQKSAACQASRAVVLSLDHKRPRLSPSPRSHNPF